MCHFVSDLKSVNVCKPTCFLTLCRPASWQKCVEYDDKTPYFQSCMDATLQPLQQPDSNKTQTVLTARRSCCENQPRTEETPGFAQIVSWSLKDIKVLSLRALSRTIRVWHELLPEWRSRSESGLWLVRIFSQTLETKTAICSAWGLQRL